MQLGVSNKTKLDFSATLKISPPCFDLLAPIDCKVPIKGHDGQCFNERRQKRSQRAQKC